MLKLNYFDISSIVLFLLALFSSLVLTWYAIKILKHFGVVDVPNNRKLHRVVTPRGGGVVLLFIYGILFSVFEWCITDNLAWSQIIIPLTLLIGLVSFLDDIKGLRVLYRLVIHVICSALLVFYLITNYIMFEDAVFFYVGIIVLTLILASYVNIYNFMDGIDGLTAIQTIHLSVTLLLLTFLSPHALDQQAVDSEAIFLITTTCWMLLAYGLAFLFFNRHPAKIFLGDVGSITIGFLLGVCCLFLASYSLKLFTAVVIANLYYLSDGGMTLLIRLSNGEKVWQPHLKHFFQQALQQGKHPKIIVKTIAFCNLLLMFLAIMSLYFPIIALNSAIVTTIVVIYLFANKKALTSPS